MIIKYRSTIKTQQQYLKYESIKDAKIKNNYKYNYYNNDLDINDEKINIEKYHPKTLVYIIQYTTIKTENIKNILVIGKDANKHTITGYDIKLSGLNEYLYKKEKKMEDKKGYTLPILYYYSNKIYTFSKIIKLKEKNKVTCKNAVKISFKIC